MRAAWWWIDRWRKSTAFTDMTAEEQGLYRNLLDEVVLRPDGIIPGDSLGKASGDAVAWQRCGPKVLKWMQRRGDGWTNETMLEVKAKGEKLSAAQREKAKARWDKKAAADAGAQAGADANGNAGGDASGSVSGSVVRTQDPTPPTSTATDCPAAVPAADSSTPKEEPLISRFVQVFNRCYGTRRGIPLLNPKARKRWAQLQTQWGPARVLCLPLLAWVYDSIKGRRVQERKVSHLLHDGTDGAWDWGQLLEAADSSCPKQGAECRRAWEVAKELGLEEGLRALHFPRPEGLDAPADTRTQEEKDRTFKALLKATLDHQFDEDYGDAARAEALEQIRRGEA